MWEDFGMNNEEIRRLKYLLKYINKRNCDVSSVRNEFDNLIKDYFGFHYSDKDIDEIIDSLDFGLGMLSWEEFKEIMLKNRENMPNKYSDEEKNKEVGV